MPYLFLLLKNSGDIIYSNSHTDVDDLVIDSSVNPANESENPGNKDENIQTATRKDQRDNEKNDDKITYRKYGHKDTETVSTDEFIKMILEEIKNKEMNK